MNGKQRQFQPVGYADLIVHVAQVILDDLLGGAELGGDFLVLVALHDESDDAQFLWDKVKEKGRVARFRPKDEGALSDFLRRELASRLRLYRFPELHFEADLGTTNAERVEQLLKRARKRQKSQEDSQESTLE